MPTDYSQFREIAERAKARGLIAHPPSPTIKKLGPPKPGTRERTGSNREGISEMRRGEHHWAILRIACSACGAPKGESCKQTIGLTQEVPVHASRIRDAEQV
jgi:hypothetical protein